MNSTVTPERYVMKFGKYKNMKAVDIAAIYEVDKNGNDKPVGLMYLKFLVEKCDWFRHREIIEQVIKNAVECMNADEKEPEQPKEEDKQKKEKKPKKEKITSKDKPESTQINLN